MSDNRAKPNYYMINHQKLLWMVGELHRRGYEHMRIIPMLSPSGLSWRCELIDQRSLRTESGSMWIYDIIQEEDADDKELPLTNAELADRFIRDFPEFMELCRGDNPEYARWYRNMLEQLQEEELPYAFADQRPAQEGYWYSSHRDKIPTLADEIGYMRSLY